MCGTFQAGIIEHTALKEHLLPFGYKPAPITSRLWCQKNNGITFNIVVEYFGIKFQRGEDNQHLINELQQKYEITKNWTGRLYSGIKLNWGYKSGILYISMPWYFKESLHKFHHPNPVFQQHSLHQWNPPKYISTAPQMEHRYPEFSKLSSPEFNKVQTLVGTFLYYAHVVDPKTIVELDNITAKQANITQSNNKAVTQLLNYTATHSEAITRYHTSGIVLHIHSDSSFL